MFHEDVTAYEALFKKGQIIDGLVNPDNYFASHIRIAWFLKEAYTNESDGWHIKKYYGGNDAYDNFFRNVATTT